MTRQRVSVGMCGAFLYWEAANVARAFVNDDLTGTPLLECVCVCL